MKSTFLIIILVSIFLIIAGCSSEVDCSEQDTQYETYELNEETGECELAEELERDVCGNGVKEEGETYCNCEEDVDQQHPEDGCYGEVGEYLEKACSSQNQCVVEENSKVTSQTKQLEFRNGDFTIKGEFTLDDPYITSDDLSNEVDISLELFETSQDRNIKDIRVESVQFFNRDDIKLAESSIEQMFGEEGSSIEPDSVLLQPLTQREDDISLRVTIPVRYTVEYLDNNGGIERTEQKTEDMRESLGTWTFINPEFIEEEEE